MRVDYALLLTEDQALDLPQYQRAKRLRVGLKGSKVGWDTVDLIRVLQGISTC
jgi:hypothetical protein